MPCLSAIVGARSVAAMWARPMRSTIRRRPERARGRRRRPCALQGARQCTRPAPERARARRRLPCVAPVAGPCAGVGAPDATFGSGGGAEVGLAIRLHRRPVPVGAKHRRCI